MTKSKSSVVRTTVSIPRDLKRQMDRVQEPVNWSAVAAQAFALKLGEIAQRKVKKDMQDVITRLRASKERGDTEAFARGREAGHEWAKDTAEADELRRLEDFRTSLIADWGRSDINGDPCGCNCYDVYRGASGVSQDDFDRDECRHFWDVATGDDNADRDNASFIDGFVTGALELWNDVKAEL